MAARPCALPSQRLTARNWRHHVQRHHRYHRRQEHQWGDARSKVAVENSCNSVPCPVFFPGECMLRCSCAAVMGRPLLSRKERARRECFAVLLRCTRCPGDELRSARTLQTQSNHVTQRKETPRGAAEAMFHSCLRVFFASTRCGDGRSFDVGTHVLRVCEDKFATRVALELWKCSKVFSKQHIARLPKRFGHTNSQSAEHVWNQCGKEA